MKADGATVARKWSVRFLAARRPGAGAGRRDEGDQRGDRSRERLNKNTTSAEVVPDARV